MRIALIPILLFFPLYLLNSHLTSGTDRADDAAATSTPCSLLVHRLKKGHNLDLQLDKRVAQSILLPQPVGGVEALTLVLRTDGTIAIREQYIDGSFATAELDDVESTVPGRAWIRDYVVRSTDHGLTISCRSAEQTVSEMEGMTPVPENPLRLHSRPGAMPAAARHRQSAINEESTP